VSALWAGPPLAAQQPTAHGLPAMQRQPNLPLALTEHELPEAYVDFPFSTSIAAIGGTGLYTVLLRSDLPNGLHLETGNGVVAITGVPTSWGTSTVTVSVADSAGTVVTHDYLLRVQPALVHPDVQMATVTVTEAIKTGDADNSFTPAKFADAESITTTDTDLILFPLKELLAEAIHVTDTVSVFGPAKPIVGETITTSDSVAVTVKLNITPAVAPAGTYNAAYSQTFTAVGNTGNVTFSLLGTLPTGITSTISSGQIMLSGTPTQAGTFPFTLKAADSANTTTIAYSLVINTASQTITVGTIPSVSYGVGSFGLSATASPSGLPVTITSTSSYATGSNPFTPIAAGTASFQATQAGNANYSAATPVNFNVAIAQALLNVTATNASRAFDQPNPSFNYGLSGFVNGDTASVVSGTPAFNTLGNPIASVGGSPYAVTPTTGTLSAANYTFAFNSGLLTVTKAPQSITFYPLPNLAHGTTFPLSARASSGLAVTYTVSGPATITNNILSVSGTGTVQVIATQTGNGNYNAATSVVRSFTAQ
jgi:hypothetical protein